MHTILFQNAQSDWNEALPLGNGVFGGMAFFRENQYRLALNHYEVYYSHYRRYSRKAASEAPASRPSSEAGASGGSREQYEALVREARQNIPDVSREDYLHYRRTIWPTADLPRQTGLQSGVSHPPTGETALILSDRLAQAENYSLRLDIEDAAVRLKAEKDGHCLQAETRILTGVDAALTQIRQSGGLVKALALEYPLGRNHEGFTVRWEQSFPDTFLCRVSFYPQGEDRDKYPPFAFAVLHRLLGAEGKARPTEKGLQVELTRQGKEFSLLSLVVTELSAEDPAAAAKRLAEEAVSHISRELELHQARWAEFFGKSAVSLPDPVLERLWYLNLYVLGCCSGLKGRRREQASGLNGLWDIRQPTKWGSLWYWDVNIEASYWPVYTANHLELAEAFNDGFLSYAGAAAQRARDFYGMRGLAMDYPHEFYNCMWPWCAQYLWWYYEYTGDLDFLREKAYPIFHGLALFIEDVMQPDPETGGFCFFPDVSPEQGPIAKNSTITLACVRYLLRISGEAAELLGRPEEEKALFQRLEKRIPPYATARLDRYGEVLKDSDLAPAGIHLRHPSLLMPIYPLWEMGQDSQPELREIAKNTLFFASENTELGVFPFGWISAAAARLGMGNTALRILYEQGLDLILRANGMGAEETDRWVNFCMVKWGDYQLYSPFMMECVGEVVNCVNEMLMQSFDGVIHLFPAVPNGNPEAYRKPGRERPVPTPWDKAPVCWQDCGFDRLLAKGGFEVSARMKGGEVCWVSIHSLRGGDVRIRLPEPLSGGVFRDQAGNAVEMAVEKGTVSFPTAPGGVYTLGQLPKEALPNAPDTLCYLSHLNRRVFIGKNRNTDAYKQIDSFLCDYYMGNDRYTPLVSCAFNFGFPLEEPGASQIPPSQNSHLRFRKIPPKLEWSPCLGFGFSGAAVSAFSAPAEDYLLQDGVEGGGETVFRVELPKGRYDILAVSCPGKGCLTRVSIGEICRSMAAGPGECQTAVLPVIQDRDGVLEIRLSSEEGALWSLNALVIRKLQAFL